ncbi:putative ribonuclease H-like domain-containing protein [Tanacetum coccineum]
MDFVEGLPKSQGKNVIMVVVDKLNKYGHFIPLAHPFTAVQVAQAFLDYIYKLHGLRESIVSDRDKVFISTFWKELFKLLNVKLLMYTTYHPQADGQTEVVNRGLECYLRCMCGETPKDWGKWLSLAEWCRVDIVDRTLTAREEVIKALTFHLKRSQERMKTQADKHRSEREFVVGDWGLGLLEATTPQASLNENLKRCKGQNLQVGILPQCDNSGLIQAQPVAILERKLGKVGNATGVFVLMQWANSRPEDAMWKSIEDIQRCRSLLKVLRICLRTSSTNHDNTASTPVNTARLSYPDPFNFANKDVIGDQNWKKRKKGNNLENKKILDKVVPTYHQDEDDQDAQHQGIQDDNPTITELIHVEYSLDDISKTEIPIVIEEDEKLKFEAMTKLFPLYVFSHFILLFLRELETGLGFLAFAINLFTNVIVNETIFRCPTSRCFSNPDVEDIHDVPHQRIFTHASYDDEGAVADFTNLESITRSKVNKSSGAHDLVSYIQKQKRNNHKDFQHYLFACFLSHIETNTISQALEDESWVDSMQEELLQFKIQMEEGIDYNEVFTPVARIEAIWIFLAFASYMGFIVYQMDVKSAFLYGTIDEEVYVSQPPGFRDPKFPNKHISDELYGRTHFFLRFQVKQKEDGIFISQDKYVAENLRKFDIMSVKTASTPIETHKPLVKDEETANVDVHLYRYLKGKPKLDLWYPRESSFDLIAYSNSDYGGANLDWKSTTGVLVTHHTTNAHQFTMSNKHQELASPKQMALALAIPGQMTTSKESSYPLIAGSLPKTIQSNDPSLSRGYILESGEDSMQLMELMENCTKLKVKVLVSKASIRRHLKFEDAEGLSSLLNTEIFEQLANMGVHSLGRDEGSLLLNELTVMCTSLAKKIEGLESELQQTKTTYSKVLTKLILRVKKLEKQVKTTTSRRKTRIVLSQSDHSKDPLKILSAAKVLAEAAKQRRHVVSTQIYTRRRKNVSTGSGGDSTASGILNTARVSTANEPGSTAGVKAQDKGNAIMIESNPPKKLKKKEQVQLSLDEELARKIQEEEQAKAIAAQEQERKNLEAALEIQRQLDVREEVRAEPTQTHEIDWNDPSVLRYHAQLNRPYSVAEDSEKEKSEGRKKRKVSKAREDKIKRQKNQDDPEKLTLKVYVQVVSHSEDVMNVIPLAIKSLKVSWKLYCKGDMGFDEMHRAYGTFNTYKFFSEMLSNFDRDDLIVLYRLFNEKYASTRPGFDDLMLWGDMKIMFDPDVNGEI